MKKTNKVFKNLYHSPTVMTWFSFSAKSLSVLIVLPLILSKFSKNEISLWFLFGILFSFQLVADLGFGSTFTRLISYAMAGLKNLDDINLKEPGSQESKVPNLALITALNKKMGVIFIFLAGITTIFLGCFSFLFLDKPIENLETPQHGYYLLTLILVVLFLKIYSRRYVSFICGLNEVALLRRWEGFITYLQILSSIAVLILSENFIFLVINNQLWVLVGIVNTCYLQKKVSKDRFQSALERSDPLILKKEVFHKHVLSPSYRSGAGNFLSYGVNYLTFFVLIDFLSDDDLAIFLLTSKVASTISEFSRAPFYANLPAFARKFPLIAREELPSLVQNSINRSILLATAGLIIVSLLGEISLKILDGKIDNFNHYLWFLWSLNLLCERTGAMHFQMHSISNNVTWHKANLVYGILFVLITVSSIDFLGLFAIPVAMLISNVCYYTPCALNTTHKFYSYKFYNFNAVALICLSLIAVCNVIILVALK